MSFPESLVLVDAPHEAGEEGAIEHDEDRDENRKRPGDEPD